MPNPLALLLSLALLGGAATPSPTPSDLPEVRLPHSSRVAKLADAPKAILTVEQNGRMTGDGRVLLPPTDAAKVDAAALAGVRSWLAGRAKEMERKPPFDGSSLRLPADPLVLRVDAFAPFELVQSVMELCGSSDLQIWRIELAVEPHADPMPPLHASDKVGDVVHAHLPVDLHTEEPIEKIELAVRVESPGGKVTDGGEPWSAGDDGPFRFDDARKLSYAIGPRKYASYDDVLEDLRRLRLADPERPMTIDARVGVTQGEVLAAMNAGYEAGFTEITFVGRRR